jgi:hypothetical protein
VFKAANVASMIHSADVENYVERGCNADKSYTGVGTGWPRVEKINTV